MARSYNSAMQPIAIGRDEIRFLGQTLRKLGFFNDLQHADLDFVLNYIRHYSVEDGEYLFRTGDPGDALFIVHQGRFRVVIKRGFLFRRTLTFLEPGQVVGEMALLEGRRRSASVQATQPSTVFALNSLDFRQILFKNPNFAKNILHVAQSRKFETDRA